MQYLHSFQPQPHVTSRDRFLISSNMCLGGLPPSKSWVLKFHTEWNMTWWLNRVLNRSEFDQNLLADFDRNAVLCPLHFYGHNSAFRSFFAYKFRSNSNRFSPLILPIHKIWISNSSYLIEIPPSLPLINQVNPPNSSTDTADRFWKKARLSQTALVQSCIAFV